MASLKVEICLKKKKTHPEHKYSVTFVSKVGTEKRGSSLLFSPPAILHAIFVHLSNIVTKTGMRANYVTTTYLVFIDMLVETLVAP